MISIIIPTLNEEEHLGSLLSFLAEHPQRAQFEVIVVDGGSRDQTFVIAKEYEVSLYCTETRSRALQMNMGAKHARGDVLFFVHADVKLIPSFVDDISQAIDEGYHSGCYRFKFHKPSSPLLCINGFFTRFAYTWCRGGDQTLFVVKNVFERIGGFDEHYVIMEDYDIIERLRKYGVSFRVIPKSIKVSARKYRYNSYLKVQFANLRAMKMYKKGVHPVEIKTFYRKALR